MSFDDLIKKGQPEKAGPKPLIIEGCFQCDFCWETIDEAEYFKAEKRLVYRHDEHETIIEGFVI